MLTWILAAAVSASAGGAYDAAMKAGAKAESADDCAKAKESYTEAVELAKEYGDGDMRYLSAIHKLGAVQEKLGDAAGAEGTLERGLATAAAPKKADPKLIGAYWWRYARVLFRQHKGERAYDAIEASIAQLTKADDKNGLADAYNDAGNILNMLDRNADSEAYRKEAIQRYRALGRRGSVATVCTNLAMHYSKRGRMDDAWPAYDCVVREGKASGGLVQRKFERVLALYAEDLRKVGKTALAEEMEGAVADIKALPEEKSQACRAGSVKFEASR